MIVNIKQQDEVECPCGTRQSRACQVHKGGSGAGAGEQAIMRKQRVIHHTAHVATSLCLRNSLTIIPNEHIACSVVD